MNSLTKCGGDTKGPMGRKLLIAHKRLGPIRVDICVSSNAKANRLIPNGSLEQTDMVASARAYICLHAGLNHKTSMQINANDQR